ncbi:DUF4998 domain-containing protein [Filimonas effusa]|uniref:DUF5013 domain-containing protein n=1 Tax=Filimonas effusa TaxID=2508721 RepID=A0A4V1MAD8_9BACT|nr:DUF4998 domain-containing protein [Filimonas effusa]RXK85526.1 DUF5013 domain-containing protein [Filimonas effusa]
MKSIIFQLTCFITVAGLLLSCNRKADDFRSFLENKELIYPGMVSNVKVLPGKNRLLLQWNPSPDPTITKYVVYWNNFQDSVVKQAAKEAPTDTVKCMITGLSEYAYSFFIYSYDNLGNKSVAIEVNNASVYGSIYEASLRNRYVNIAAPSVVNSENSVTLNFLVPDTINITTEIKYTATGGVEKKAYLHPDSPRITLNDYLPGTTIQYRSSYIPKRGAIDTFYATKYDAFPAIQQDVTNTYIKNAGSPMTASTMNGGRWGNLADWIVNSAVKNHDGFGGYDNVPGYGTISMEYWGTPQIVNGKVYQTFVLPPGNYNFITTVQNIDYTLQSAYIVAAAGNTVPDVANYATSLAYKKMTDNSMNNTDQSISFTLQQSTEVAIGFIATMTNSTQGVRIKAVRLKRTAL